jgi:hypothetical protein
MHAAGLRCPSSADCILSAPPRQPGNLLTAPGDGGKLTIETFNAYLDEA